MNPTDVADIIAGTTVIVVFVIFAIITIYVTRTIDKYRRDISHINDRYIRR